MHDHKEQQTGDRRHKNKSLADGWAQIPVNHHFQLKDQKIFKAEEEQIEREGKEVPFIVVSVAYPESLETRKHDTKNLVKRILLENFPTQ